MKAIWYDAFGKMPMVREVDPPKIHPDAVLVKVVSTGLCRSDWYGWLGHDPDIKLPHVPGHEFAGEVVEVGKEVTQWTPGRRITSPFIQACGSCRYCVSHNHQVCERQEQAGFSYWGSFAEYVEVRYADTNLVAIPDWMSFDEAAVLGCRFGTAYRALVDQAGIMAGQWLCVFGCGGVGLAAIMIAKALGGRIIAVEPSEKARTLALSLGAREVFTSANDSLKTYLEEFQTGGIDVTLDAVGKPEVIHHAMRILKRRGQHIQVGLLPPDYHTVGLPLAQMISFEQEVKGSHGIQAFRYPSMFELIQNREISLESLIQSRVSLHEATELLANMDTSESSGITIINPWKS